jgi:hypothetical protein
MSTVWYTWIERARDLNLPIATLDIISRALRFNTEEAIYSSLLTKLRRFQHYKQVDELIQRSRRRCAPWSQIRPMRSIPSGRSPPCSQRTG